jgi:hypothetical protein
VNKEWRFNPGAVVVAVKPEESAPK